MNMSSSVLIHDLRKSLYQRLYYALVDSDYVIKALNEQQVETMIREINRNESSIQYLRRFLNNNTGLRGEISFSKIPIKFRESYKEDIEILGKEHSTRKRLSANKKIQAVNDAAYIASGKAYTELNKETINTILEYYGENPEEMLLLEYIQKNHPTETKKKVIQAINKYEKKLNVQRDKADKVRAGEYKDKKDEADKKSSKIKESLDKKFAELETQKNKDKKKRGKSAKLLDEWIMNANKQLPFGPQTKDALDGYKTLISVLDLVGSLYLADKNTILRLKKFLGDKEIEDEDGNVVTVPEQVISQQDRAKLTEILEELEKEVEAKKKVRARHKNISSSQLEAKERGIEIGKGSKYRTKRKSKDRTSLRVNYGSDYRTFNKDFLKKFETINLKENMWFTNEYLREIGNYWLEKMEYTQGHEAWIEEKPMVKENNIKKVRNFLPEYPSTKGKINLTSQVVTLFNDIWDDYVINPETSAEDFAYFAQGIRDGLLSSNKDSKVSEFAKLRMFETDILPKLITAVKKGVIIDENNKLKFRLGPAFSKIMKAYGNASEVRSVVEDLIDIAKGDTISEKYSGRDADELEALENNIVTMLSEKVAGETILSYIISTFLKLYKTTTILRRLINTDTLIDVKYLSPSGKAPSSLQDKPVKGEPKPESYEPKGALEAGKKLHAFVDKEWRRLKRVKNKDGTRKYTDKQIHQMVGWKKTKVDKTVRELSGGLARDKKGKPKTTKTTKYVKYRPSIYENLKEAKKSLDNLLVVLGEEDNIIIKEDIGLILESLNKTQKKKIKAILNIADPTEYFGHDFLKLSELIRVLRTLGVVKGDKKLNKKVLKLDDENIKVVKLATRLRKDYENLYRDLRELIYPKSGE